MSVKNYENLGIHLMNIMDRLMTNDNLVNLLYYTDSDPLNNPPLSVEEKRAMVYEKLIKIGPHVGTKETAQSVLAIRVESARGDDENGEFKNIIIKIDVIVPLTQWIIRSTNLRPFLILGEVQKSLNGKRFESVGKMYGGDFELNFLTDEVCGYEQTFYLLNYE